MKAKPFETRGNHSYIPISVKDDKASSIADAILMALEDFEKKHRSLEIIGWKLERFDNADNYVFIDHKIKKVCSRN